MSDTDNVAAAMPAEKKVYKKPSCVRCVELKVEKPKLGRGKDHLCVEHGAKVPKCTKCHINNQEKGGICRSCGAVALKCTECGVNNRKNGGLCGACGAARKMCIKCNVNCAVLNGICKACGANKDERLLCSVEGCRNQKVQGNLCTLHGAERKLCSVAGCEKQVQNNSVCVEHGSAVRMCSVANCGNQVRNNGVCIRHGARKFLCIADGCTNQKQKGHLCVQHGARVTADKCKYCKITKGSNRVAKDGSQIRACARCFYYYHPDENVPRRYMLKQHYIHDELKKEFGEDFFKYDQVVDGGCSRRRPDWMRDCGTFTIIIECDEDEHKRYEGICENKRMMALFQDLADRPLIVIRFNPDSYTDGKGERVQGCFRISTDNSTITPHDVEFDKRFSALKETIKRYVAMREIDREIVVEKLFFSVLKE